MPYFDTGQFFLYIFFLILPFLVGCLIHLLEPSNDQELSLLFKLLTRDLAVPRFPFNQRTCTRKREKKRKLKPVSAWKTGDDANRPKAKTYLWALAQAAFWVGCYVELVFVFSSSDGVVFRASPSTRLFAWPSRPMGEVAPPLFALTATRFWLAWTTTPPTALPTMRACSKPSAFLLRMRRRHQGRVRDPRTGHAGVRPE